MSEADRTIRLGDILRSDSDSQRISLYSQPYQTADGERRYRIFDGDGNDCEMSRFHSHADALAGAMAAWGPLWKPNWKTENRQ